MSHSPKYLKSMYLLHCCAEIMGGPQFDEGQAEVYFTAVGSTDGDAVVAALRHWLAHERRFPAPVDIRQTIEQIQKAGQAETEQTA